MKKLLLFLLLFLPFVSAAQQWEMDIGQGINNLAGQGSCTNMFYTGISCGSFIIGLTLFLVFIYYCFATGLSSEVIIPVGGFGIVMIATFSFLPYFIGFAAVLIGGLLIYKAISQVPNG